MNAAAAAMRPAADKLQQQKWADAIPDEQKALQYLLRAEATFRQIQVAFGSRRRGRWRRRRRGPRPRKPVRPRAGYREEPVRNRADGCPRRASAQQEIDEALQKLEHWRAASKNWHQQHNGHNQTNEQRWQQEMLRREAEELQRQMEQLAQQQQEQQGQGQQGQQGQQSGQQSGQQGSQQGQASGQASGQSGQASGQPGASGASGQSANDQRVQQALDRLRQAQEDMARAASPDQSQAAARRAADRLREATDLMNGMRQQAFLRPARWIVSRGGAPGGRRTGSGQQGAADVRSAKRPNRATWPE